MKDYSECYFKEVVLGESSFASIFVSGNSVYIMGNIDVEHPIVKAELDAIREDIFESGRDLVNVVHSTDVNVYNVYREGSEAEQLLKEITDTDFRNLDLGTPELPDFNNVGTSVEDYVCQ